MLFVSKETSHVLVRLWLIAEEDGKPFLPLPRVVPEARVKWREVTQASHESCVSELSLVRCQRDVDDQLWRLKANHGVI